MVRFCVWRKPTSQLINGWLPFCCNLTWQKEQENFLWVSFRRSLIPSMKTVPHDLITSQSPHPTSQYCHIRHEISTHKFWGDTNIQAIANIHILWPSTLLFIIYFQESGQIYNNKVIITVLFNGLKNWKKKFKYLISGG